MNEFKNIDKFNPQECLLGRISRIDRMTSALFRTYISPFGISNSQTSLLFILSKFDGLNQKQLTEIAKLEKSSLHRNLKRLVDSGYVSRSHFPIFKLTEEGKKMVNAIIPEWEKAMAEMRSLLGPEEAAISRIHHILSSKL